MKLSNRIKALSMAFLISITMSASKSEGTVKQIVDEIKSVVKNSTYLTEEEKTIILNDKLLEDVVPYAKAKSNALVRLHTNLEILPYNKEDYENLDYASGYWEEPYIHINGYNKNAASGNRGTIAHEYAHLLQDGTSDPSFKILTKKNIYYGMYFSLISESLADIVKDEYYYHDADHKSNSQYETATKYTKVLMEIIGPLPVWQYYCNMNRGEMIDEISKYLSDDELFEFAKIVSHHPYHHKAYLEQEGGYQKLEELLGVMYKNKYNDDMSNNGLINAILHNGMYKRAYFNSEIIDDNDYFQEPLFYGSIGDAYKNGYAKLSKVAYISKNTFLNAKEYDGWKRYFQIFGFDRGIKKSNVIMDPKTGEFSGTVIFDDNGEVMEVNDAIKNYEIEIQFAVITEDVSPEEFDSKWTIDDYLTELDSYYSYIPKNSGINYYFEPNENEDVEIDFDIYSGNIRVAKKNKVYIPSITEKFPNDLLTRNN